MAKKRTLKEERILKKAIEMEQRKKKEHLKSEIKHFDFSDFAQGVIGTGVFGLPAFINTSFWDYLPQITTFNMFLLHLFFLFCVIIATNYRFRSDFSFDVNFFKPLIRRLFFLYITVLITITILLIILNKFTGDISTLLLLRYFLAGQSVGIVGATTFTFFTKE